MLKVERVQQVGDMSELLSVEGETVEEVYTLLSLIFGEDDGQEED